MSVISRDITIRVTDHFAAQARARRLSASALFACVAAEAPRLMAYQGCRLALDFGGIGIAVVKVEPAHLELLTVLAPGQLVLRSDTLRLRVTGRQRVDRQGAAPADKRMRLCL
jgi:hypothetical protein